MTQACTQEDIAGIMDLDTTLDMDVDAMPDDVAAELNTRATKGLEGPGPAGEPYMQERVTSCS